MLLQRLSSESESEDEESQLVQEEDKAKEVKVAKYVTDICSCHFGLKGIYLLLVRIFLATS